MTTDPKIVEIERTLERAAHAALYGSRQARSGQFKLLFTDEKRIAGMLLREAQAAYQSWANWEAINELLKNPAIGEAILDLEFNSIGTVRAALVRDAILKAFELSAAFDPIKHWDRVTLRRFVLALQDKSNFPELEGKTKFEFLTSKQGALDLGHSPVAALAASEANHQRAERLRSLSPTPNVDATADKFDQLRKVLWPVRNRLAHAIEPDGFGTATVEDIGAFIRQTLEFATDVALIFLGHAVTAEAFTQTSKTNAEKFWTVALRSAAKSNRV